MVVPMLVNALSLGHAAWAATVDFECTSSGEKGALGIVGVPPLEVTCTVLPPEECSYSEVSWTVGDGELYFGDTITHVYDETGQFTVSVQLADYAGGDPADQ